MSSRLLALLVITVAAAAQPPKAPVYEIRGTLVDHLTSRPISKALLRLTPITGPGQLTSLTGDDGRFEFVNVPRGKYRLMAQRRGYFAHAFHETGQYSTAIVVGPGLDATNIVFPLRAPASINGIVVDEDGAPVPAVNILEYREVVNEGEKRVVQMGNYQTDSAGRFHVGQLPAGRYFIAVRGSNVESESSLIYPMTYNGDVTDARAAQPIVVNEGESAQIQIALHPVPNIHIPIGELRPERGGRLPQLFERGPGDSLIPAGVMMSKPDGTSEITGLSAGTYVMRIFAGRRNRLHDSAVQEVEVADGVSLPAPPSTGAPTISGTVTVEGGSLPSALNVMFSEGSDLAAFGIRVRSDGTLDSAVSPVAPGSYLVSLGSNDYYIKSVAVEGAKFTGDRIELTENCQAKLSIVAAPSANLSHLDGFALRNDSPIAGAMILLVPRDPNRSTLYRRDQTDSDGSFGIANVIPGQYTLVAIDDDGRGLLYKDPAVIRPYLAAGQSISFPRGSDAPVKINVQPRLR